jgi:hypothetical protein
MQDIMYSSSEEEEEEEEKEKDKMETSESNRRLPLGGIRLA